MYTIQQEILLLTNSTFSQKQWCEKEITEGNKQLSQMKRLEVACWNGLLSELLPELMEQSSYGKTLFLWQIRQGKASLHIQLSESTMQLDRQLSIDPYLFLTNLLLAN